MTREERLVLLLARGRLTESERDRAQSLLFPAADWTRCLRLARRHEVVPFVHKNLECLGFPGVPCEVREALQAGRRAVAARNALLGRELAHVMRILADAGVPAIPMKGVLLAETLYGDPSLRDCSDMDVLVPRDRAREALRLLRAQGYASEFSEQFFEALLLRGHIEYTLARRERGFEYVIDLHWGIGWSAPDDRRAAAALWAESHPVTRLGVQMQTMSPHWELLTLAVHAARHGWSPLKWLVDVHDYCQRRPVDWQKLRLAAERFDWMSALEQTFGACQMLLGTPTPPGLAAVWPARWAPTLERQSRREPPEALRPLRVIGSCPARGRYLLRQLFIPTLAERRLLRLPSGLRLLYYPLRPVRLSGKWGWQLLRAIPLRPRGLTRQATAAATRSPE
jgi:hypothetical protein